MKKISICMTILFLTLSFSLAVSAADKADIKMNGVHTTNNPTVSDVDGHAIEINKSIEKVESNQYIDVKLMVKSTDMNMNVPKTGDVSTIIPIVLTLIVSCGLVVLARKKSRKSMLSLLLISALLPSVSSNAITVQARNVDLKYTTMETFSDEIFESFTFDKVISISAGTSDVVKNNEDKITGIKWNVADANSERSLVYRLLLNDTVQDNLLDKDLNVSSAYLDFKHSGSKATKIVYPDVSIKLTTSESTPSEPTPSEPTPPASAFKLTYNANGQTGSHEDTDIPSGDSYTIKSAGDTGISSPTFIFNNWNTAANGSGTPYSPGQTITVTGDMILYAQWYAVPPVSFTVTYDANGQTGSHADADISSGDSYTVKNAIDIGISSPTLDFAGWNTAPNGSGTSYSAGAIINITNNVTLYAQWVFNPEA